MNILSRTKYYAVRETRNKIRPYFFLLAFNSILRRIPTNLVRRMKTAY